MTSNPDPRLSVTDVIALLTGAVSLPFLIGFFHWVGFLQAHGIDASEVELSQADYLLAALNVLPDGRLPGFGALAIVAVLVIGLWFIAALLQHDPLRPAPQPGSAQPTANRFVPLRQSLRRTLPGRFPGLVLGYVTLACMAIVWGYGTGRDRAEAQFETGRGITAAVVSLSGGTAGGRFDAMPPDAYLTSAGRSRLLFNDGRTAFIFVANPGPGSAPGVVLRIPIDGMRGLVTTIPIPR